MWLSFQKQQMNTSITCTLCLSTSGSTVWSSSQPSVNFQEWDQLLGSSCLQGRHYDPARRTWKLWLKSLHHKPTLQSEPFWAWWDIMDSLLRGLCASCNNCMGICLFKVPVRTASMSCSWNNCWVPLRCFQKPVFRLLCRLLLISISNFPWKLMQA